MSSSSQAVSPYGIHQGKFNVNSSGIAIYKFPIHTPPGINKHQPKLALTYNHKAKNDRIGVGWALEGLSVITRIPAIEAVDGFRGRVAFNTEDRYALDGERLINITGYYGKANTVYYTELHQWKQITQKSQGFELCLKNGEKWEYGTTPDSLIKTGDGSQVRCWALAKKTDLCGNVITYTYTDSPAGVTGLGADENYYISEISYNKAKVSFAYTTRPDKLVTFMGGHKIETSCLLQSITSQIQNTAGTLENIITNTLNYQQGTATGLSRLETIIMTDSAGNELPPVSFNWQDIDNPSFHTGQPVSKLVAIGSNSIKETIPMDITGNGLTDIVTIKEHDDSGNLYAHVFTASITGSGKINYTELSNSPFELNNGPYSGHYQILSGDVTGNGLTDLIVAYSSGQESELLLDVYLAESSGDINTTAITSNTGANWHSESNWIYAIDANGNGCIDIVQAHAHNPNEQDELRFNTCISQKDGTFASAFETKTGQSAPSSRDYLWAMDLFGNGIMQMVAITHENSSLEPQLVVRSFYTDTAALQAGQFYSTHKKTQLTVTGNDQVKLFPADANGDGLMDIVQITGSSSTDSNMVSFLSKGDGTFTQGTTSTFGNPISGHHLYPMGFLGNANSCVLHCYLDSNQLFSFSNYTSDTQGNFTSQGPPTSTSEGLSNWQPFFVGDANGNGKADLFTIHEDDSHLKVQPFTATGPYPDLMSSITDMLGNQTSITYAPLTDSQVYSDSRESFTYPKTSAKASPSKMAPAQYPKQRIMGEAMYVVSSYTSSNDSSINRFAHSDAVQMTYSGARIDLSGRGWEGFKTVTSQNLGTGKIMINTYNQDFPFTSTLFSTEVQDANNGNQQMSLTQTTYKSVAHASATAAKPNSTNAAYEVQASASVTSAYHDGDFDYAMAKSFDYDGHGNKKLETWHGYVSDPGALVPTIMPGFTPLNAAEVVYTVKTYQNDVPPKKYPQSKNPTSGWALGYLLTSKETSVEPTGSYQNAATFETGDFNLVVNTWYAGSYKPETKSKWDSGNKVWLKTQYHYDSFGNKTSETNPAGNTTTFTIESFYNSYLEEKQLPPAVNGENSITTYYGFDPRFGKSVAHKDANGFVHIEALDGFGRLIGQQGPQPSGCTQSDPNLLSSPSLITGSQSFGTANILTMKTMSYENDGSGGIYLKQDVLQNFPTNSSREYLWNKKYIDGLHRTTQTVVWTGQAAGNSVVLTEYASDNKRKSESMPFFSTTEVNPTPASPATIEKTSFVHDVLGRIKSVTKPPVISGDAGTVQTFTYHKAEVVNSTEGTGVDAYMQILTSHHYHGKRKIVSVAVGSATGPTTSFQYDPIARLTNVKDPESINNTFTYDSLNRKLTADNPDQNPKGAAFAIKHAYDKTTGLLKTITDASGATETASYDNLGRVKQRSYSEGRVVGYTYDTSTNGTGLLATTTISDGSTQVVSKGFESYDVYGKLTEEQLTFGSGTDAETFNTSYEYDPCHRLLQQTNPDGSVISRVYSFGLLSQQSIGTSLAMEYPLEQYDANGAFQQANGYYGGTEVLNSGFSFGANGIMTDETLKLNSGTTNLLDFDYELDQLNQLSGITESVNSTSQAFTYANKSIATANTPKAHNSSSSFTFDGAGDIKTKDGNTYSYNGNHFPENITTPAKTNPPAAAKTIYSATQDDCGRMTSRTYNGETLTFDYDATGQLKGVTNGDTSLCQMVNDENGKRLMETDQAGNETYYINPTYTYQQPSGKTTGTKVNYLFDKNGIVACKTTPASGSATYLFFRNDHKGSVTHAFDHKGTLQAEIAYDAFGNEKLVSGTRTFNPLYENRTKNNDTGLYYFGARYYDPIAGIFITPDSEIGGHSQFQPNVWNRFAFELNDPINHIDPTGHFSWKGFGKGILDSVVATVVSVATCNPLLASAAEAGVQTAMGKHTGKSFGLHFAADFTCSAINDVVAVPFIMTMPETGGASALAEQVVLGAEDGAISGFFDSLAEQGIMSGHVNSDDALTSMGISAGVGTVGGLLGGKSGAVDDVSAFGHDAWTGIKATWKDWRYRSKNGLSLDAKGTMSDVDGTQVAIMNKLAWAEYIDPYNPRQARSRHASGNHMTYSAHHHSVSHNPMMDLSEMSNKGYMSNMYFS